MTLLAGTTLGPYKILSPLGKGGMGEVYRAHDARLGRDVAVKVLPERMAQNAEALARFEREARAVAALSHPNILTVFDVGTQDGVSYVVTELLEGETLRSQLRAGALPWHKAVEIGGHIADGLAAAHEKGVIHRDVKPENIFLTSGGVVKILDFGLARFAHSALSEGGDEARTLTLDTKPGTVLGTAHYMSPEQVRGKPVDARGDIFSLGCVLHEMVTGTKTFSGDTSADLTTAILKEDPPSMIDSCGDVSPEFERVVARCLEKRPEQRFHAASDLAFTLRTLVSGSGSSGGAGGYEAPRSRLALGLVVGVVAVAVILVTVFLMTRDTHAPKAETRVLPLTSFVGVEGSPSFSPGGDFVAFDYNPDGPADIYVMSTSGGPHRLIVQSPSDDTRPRWSPDNRYLAFVSGRGLTAAVYLVPPFGGTEQRLVGIGVDAVEGLDDTALGAQPWSPDAKRLLFSKVQPVGGMAVWEIDVGTREQRQLTQPGADQDDLGATYTSDGKRIAFARRHGTQADLLVLHADTGALRVVLADGHENLEPAWSTDDGRLIFSSNRSGVTNLWELDLSSDETRRLTTGQGDDKNAVVAPDGRIAYHQFSHQTDLYLVSVDDDGASASRTAARRLTSNTKDNFGARFSPDGTKILYHSSRSGNFELWCIDLADGAERQLTSDPHTDVFGDWSPDGETITFVSDRDGEFRLWRMNADGGELRRISPEVIAIRAGYYNRASTGPRCSADGKAIAYLADTEERSVLWTMKADGSEARAIVPGVLGFDWYLDSRRIVYSRMAEGRDDVKEMRARNLETGDEVVLLRSPHTELIVSADGTSVAYCKAASHFDMDLYRLKLRVPADANDLPTIVGEPQRLTKGQERWHVHNGSWSPDGKQIVYTRDTDSADISIIEVVK